MEIKRFFIVLFVFLISFIFPIALVSAENFGYNYIESINADRLGGFLPGFFMPLNKSVFGQFDFNGGWLNDGLSIIGGDLYAQTLFVFNITSLNVTVQNVTITEDLTIEGNSSANWFNGLFNWTTISNFLSFNGHTLTFDDALLNATIIDLDFWTNDTSEDNLINSTGANIKVENITADNFIGDGSQLTNLVHSLDDAYDDGSTINIDGASVVWTILELPESKRHFLIENSDGDVLLKIGYDNTGIPSRTFVDSTSWNINSSSGPFLNFIDGGATPVGSIYSADLGAYYEFTFDATSGNDIAMILGDDAGSNFFFVYDSSFGVPFSVDSIGNGVFTGNVTASGLNLSFTRGSVIFQDANGLAEDNTNFFWNDSNNRLGIGTDIPSTTLDVNGNITYGTIINSSLNGMYVENTATEYIIWG